MNDLSIDIETLGVTVDSYILSIGAVPFDRTTGLIYHDKFHVQVEGLQEGRRIDPNTVRWWMTQGHEARVRVFANKGAMVLRSALDAFAAYVRHMKPTRVWGNGAHFDIGILEHAMIQHDIELPWHFKGVRDMRTIVDIAKEWPEWTFIPQTNTLHDALNDAEHQARVISKAFQLITGVENNNDGELE